MQFSLRLCLMLLVVSMALPLRAELVKKNVEYRHGDTVLEGYLVYQEGTTAKRPGVLVIHEWWGVNDYARSRAEQLAEMGYVAFALDMYGKGVLAKTHDEAAQLASQYRGQPIIRTRAQAGLDVLAKYELVDPERIAAIGYCFGGTTALELAYSGANLAGIVSFHGGLVNPQPQEAEKIKAKLLVLHGADDPFVPPAQVDSFHNSLRDTPVDWQMIYYSDAVHTFTNPAAGNDKSTGVAYNEKADRRSWQHMQLFFDEIFK